MHAGRYQIAEFYCGRSWTYYFDVVSGCQGINIWIQHACGKFHIVRSCRLFRKTSFGVVFSPPDVGPNSDAVVMWHAMAHCVSRFRIWRLFRSIMSDLQNTCSVCHYCSSNKDFSSICYVILVRWKAGGTSHIVFRLYELVVLLNVCLRHFMQTVNFWASLRYRLDCI